MTDAIVVLVTAPDPDKAAAIARVLIDQRLAACGNVVPGVRSIYRWEGQIRDEKETLLMLKTTAAQFEALRESVLELHPYAVPEVIALRVEAGSAPYLAWIEAETS